MQELPEQAAAIFALNHRILNDKRILGKAIDEFNGKEHSMDGIMDRVVGSLFSKGYEVNLHEEEDVTWIDEGKYSYGNATYSVVLDGEKYYIQLGQTRSGSYYSDYYYQDVDYNISSDSEYNAPKVVYTHKEGELVVDFYDAGVVKLNGVAYPTLSEAFLNNLITPPEK